MSLDVSLLGPEQQVERTCYCCGNVSMQMEREEYYSANITHNLSTMADKAGLYTPLWHPERAGLTKASHLIPLLTEGLQKIKADPTYYREFNAKNAWGLYEHFVPFVEEYLNACIEHPDAEVSVS